MQEITKQSVLKVFQEKKQISSYDLYHEIFFIGHNVERSNHLENILAELIKEGIIMPTMVMHPSWVIVE